MTEATTSRFQAPLCRVAWHVSSGSCLIGRVGETVPENLVEENSTSLSEWPSILAASLQGYQISESVTKRTLSGLPSNTRTTNDIQVVVKSEIVTITIETSHQRRCSTCCSRRIFCFFSNSIIRSIRRFKRNDKAGHDVSSATTIWSERSEMDLMAVSLNANADFCTQGLRSNRALLMVERGHAVLSTRSVSAAISMDSPWSIC